MNRRQRKRIITAVLLVGTAMLSAEAASPQLADQPSTFLRSETCGQKGLGGDFDSLAWGTCTAGSADCCGGFPQAPCEPAFQI